MKRILRHVGAKDFRKTHQRKLDEQRALYLERREEEIQEEKQKKNIEEAAKPFKSDWRKEILKEFGEWVPIANAGGPTMGTSTTFGYYVGGSPLINVETGQPITYTASGLGGADALPTTVTIDQGFGDIANVDAPTYNQLSLAGYAPVLPFFRRKDYKDVNELLNASQEYARRVLADVYMGARAEFNKEVDRQEAERTEMMNKVSSYVSQLGIDFEKLQKGAQIDKYGRLVILNYDGGVLGGLKNSNNRSITIYNPAKDARGNLLKIQYTGTRTLQKGETVLGTQYGRMPDETTVQTWSNVGSVAHFTDFGSWHNPNEIGERLVGDKKVGPKIVGSKAVGKGYNDLLDKLADTFKVGTSKNFFDYYKNNFVRGKQKQNPNLTNLIEPEDIQWLEKTLSADPAINNPKASDDPQEAFGRIMLGAPTSIQNSVGNESTLDLDYYRKTGNFKIDKTYQFTEYDDLGFRGGNNFLSNIGSIGTKGYAHLTSPAGYVGDLIKNPMRYHVIIKNNRKKNQNEPTLWDRIKKHGA